MAFVNAKQKSGYFTPKIYSYAVVVVVVVVVVVK